MIQCLLISKRKGDSIKYEFKVKVIKIALLL